MNQPAVSSPALIRVVLPPLLRRLAGIDGEIALFVGGPVTQRSILDALETRYPMLRGTIRDHVSGTRRPMVRFFADEEDVTHRSPDSPLPGVIATGAAPFLIIAAIAGG